MRLDQELVRRKLCESRTEAQELIESGYVLVGGVITKKQTKQVTEDTKLEVTKRRQFVSRGGDKLKGVLQSIFKDDDSISQFCTGKNALDIGSSTGGFTDCLLSYGVLHVDAVDIGTSQLHAKLRSNPNVTLYENTDIRNFISTCKYDIVVADLSFIPLSNVFDTIINFGKKETYYFLLIKPQFEVGKGNTKKGIVKDKELIQTILMQYEDKVAENDLEKVIISPCVISGGDGNQEYFLCCIKK